MSLKQYHFDLTKSEYLDGWDAVMMPSLCVHNENFTVVHALHFLNREYTQMKHNELSDSFVKLLSDVCHDVKIEPYFQPMQSKTLLLNQRQLMTMQD